MNATPSIESQRNVDMRQQPRHSFFFSNRNSGKFQTIYSEQPNDDMPHPFPSTMDEIDKNKAFSDIETMNSANLNPRTMMNYAQAPYGMARGEMSLITDLEMNRVRKPLMVNNNSEIRAQQQRANMVKIKYNNL